MNDAERRGGSRHSGDETGNGESYTLSPGRQWHVMDTVLRRGRAYFPTGIMFRPELPSPDFVLWGDKVLARIKKLLSRAPAIAPYIYASADALRWIEQDDVTGNDLVFRKTGTDR